MSCLYSEISLSCFGPAATVLPIDIYIYIHSVNFFNINIKSVLGFFTTSAILSKYVVYNFYECQQHPITYVL